MKKASKLFLGVCLAIGLAIAFTGCASAPPALGQTLEETLGKPMAELEEMLDKTQAEFENLLGRKLRKDEVDSDGYFVENFPKTGLTALFTVKNERISDITIGTFPGQKGFVTLAEQTEEKFDNSVIRVNGSNGSRSWLSDHLYISISPPNKNGNVYWNIQKR